MRLWQYRLLVTARCFGRFLRPSSGVLKTVVAATGHGSGWYISSKDVQGRLSLHYTMHGNSNIKFYNLSFSWCGELWSQNAASFLTRQAIYV